VGYGGGVTQGGGDGTDDWELDQDRALLAALRQGLAAWDIDWGQLVAGRTMEQVRLHGICKGVMFVLYGFLGGASREGLAAGAD
jgi:hypothetical protein